jgi:hypothetical protein
MNSGNYSNGGAVAAGRNLIEGNRSALLGENLDKGFGRVANSLERLTRTLSISGAARKSRNDSAPHAILLLKLHAVDIGLHAHILRHRQPHRLPVSGRHLRRLAVQEHEALGVDSLSRPEAEAGDTIARP